MNSDQGVQFTSEAYLAVLKAQDVKISMNGKGRAVDNNFHWTVMAKCKIWRNLCSHPGGDGLELYSNLSEYFWRFNEADPKEALGYQTVRNITMEKQLRIDYNWKQ